MYAFVDTANLARAYGALGEALQRQKTGANCGAVGTVLDRLPFHSVGSNPRFPFHGVGSNPRLIAQHLTVLSIFKRFFQ